jgi:hypothetical protein
MCHPHVAEDEASRPVITEVFMYLDELETMTTGDEEIPTPKFALPRFHDVLFVIGGRDKNWRPTDYFETYSTRADRWTKVSGTHLHSYCALLSNCVPRLRSLVECLSPGGQRPRPGHSMWDLWWTKWQWDRIFSEFFGLPVSICNSTVVLQTHII